MTITAEMIPQTDPLQIADRCDQCGAQAFVRVVFRRNKDLLFCGHHYSKHEPALMTSYPYAVVYDERRRINQKPSLSANAD
ncbi:DUF7455 domain-containing protein [Planomonospora parontospora]|uniref:DUF7455 domain-containing protein n=1 Tax=Planomonospora parontospora TaxID=58119 RepID=UPI0016712A9A|nr:hypothetical protein [Planomonospora parontospora]GGL47082.1 hypothetical protein GCM10014719_55510 [Planomonospora parontospora subsp. antibiotica]GII19922.1 hypothetical protein Ppa05_66480 [Planomonospora parontospora subsp. antibiotica]